MRLLVDSLLNQMESRAASENKVGFLFFKVLLHLAEREQMEVSQVVRMLNNADKFLPIQLSESQNRQYNTRLQNIAMDFKLRDEYILPIKNRLSKSHSKGAVPHTRPEKFDFIPANYQLHWIEAIKKTTSERLTLRQMNESYSSEKFLANTLRLAENEINCHLDLLFQKYFNEITLAQTQAKDGVESVFEKVALLAKRLYMHGEVEKAIYLYDEVLNKMAVNIERLEDKVVKKVNFFHSLKLNFLWEHLLGWQTCNLNEFTTGQLSDTACFWIQNEIKLHQIRERFAKRVKDANLEISIDDCNKEKWISSIDELQRSIVTEMTIFISNLFTQSESLLGTQPCNYAVLALGSISRKDMTPYSDLEFCILVEDATHVNSEKTNYFNLLLRLFEVQALCMGESTTEKQGFHCDQQSNPAIDTELIGTPAQLSKRYGLKKVGADHEGEDEDKGKAGGVHAFTMLKPYLVHGNPGLFNQYNKLIKVQLVRQEVERKAKAIELLKMHNKAFAKSVFNLPNKCDIKVKLLAPFIYVLNDFALYYNISERRPIEILTKLLNHDIITEQTFSNCQLGYSLAYYLRLRVHLEKDSSIDSLDLSCFSNGTEYKRHLDEFSQSISELYKKADSGIERRNSRSNKCQSIKSDIETLGEELLNELPQLNVYKNRVKILQELISNIVATISHTDSKYLYSISQQLENLLESLQLCYEIIIELSGKNWLSRLSNRVADSEKIDNIIKSLQKSSASLGVDMSAVTLQTLEEARNKDANDIIASESDIISETISQRSTSSSSTVAQQRSTSSSTGTSQRTSSSSSTGTPQRTTSSSSTGAQKRSTSSSSTGTPQRATSSSSTGTPQRTTSSSSTGAQQRATSSSSTGTPQRTTSSSSTGAQQRSTSSSSTGTPPRATSSCSSGMPQRSTSSSSSGKSQCSSSSTATGPAQTSQQEDRNAESISNFTAEDYFQRGFASYDDKDYKKAFDEYRKASEAGCLKAYARLGVFYHKGRDRGGVVEQDDQRAFDYFSRSAEDGDSFAMYNLAVMLMKGWSNVPPDLDTAEYWARKAREKNEEDAGELLEKIQAKKRSQESFPAKAPPTKK